ncbi:MAG: adenylate/guanylate cyclase domain-containing protein [Cyanobacteriota bacterium]|nr:adenylate/guanylate cyclase domain-containing protein [Cyanobacteriota bacterium]
MLKPRLRPLPLLGAAVVAWVGWTAGWPGPRWHVWERGLEDQLQALLGPRQPPPGVVLVTVDDATLQVGDWFEQNRRIPTWAQGVGSLPWPRAAYGETAERLLRAGAAAVAINVVFEGTSSRGPADDQDFAARLQRHPGRIALAAEMLEAEDRQGAGSLTLVRPEGFLTALGGTGALGLTNTLTPRPGEPTLHPEAYARGVLGSQNAASLPSLSTTLLRLAGRHSRQVDSRSSLNVYGPEGTFTRLSAWEVLDPDRWRAHPRRQALQGALVLLGPVVAQGDGGYPTPFGSLSALELLATATANSLQGDGLQPWPSGNGARALLAIAPLLAALGLGRLRPGIVWRLGSLSLVLVGVIGAGLVTLRQAHRWLPVLPPVAGLVLLGAVAGSDAYLREQGERRRLRRTFERYVAPGVVAEILADPAAADGILRGRLLEVTVLMSDLKGFTSLTAARSEAGESELHVRQLNEYLGAMVEVVTAHGGTIDKFIGDAVMAVFGSPVSRGTAEEARAAVACALAMRRELAACNAAWQARGITPLDNGVGLASGRVMVGQIGSPRRMEFTVIGDTVNLAARLEAVTRRVEPDVVFDARTAELLAGDPALEVVALGPQEVKGIGAVEVFSARAAEPAG